MKSRLLVAVIFIPLLIYIMLFGDLLLLIFASVIIGASLFEFFRMMRKSGREVALEFGIILGLIVPTYSYLQYKKIINIEMFFLLFTAFALFVLITRRVFQNKVEGASSYIGNTLLGVFYISFMFSHIFGIRTLPNGGKWLLTIQLLMWVADSSAYFVGLSLGRKIFKKGLCEISPKKSKEGFIGSLVFTVLAMFAIKQIYFQNINVSGIQLVIIPIIVATVGMLGDLSESMFKREFEIKDSGVILGGHGGILDRFDSLIFVLPVMYYYFVYILDIL